MLCIYIYFIENTTLTMFNVNVQSVSTYSNSKTTKQRKTMEDENTYPARRERKVYQGSWEVKES